MGVVALELENFKSYAGHQTIGPFTNFTCVIGPNGAGKSNLMDAMSFVFGVQSRQLRSSVLRDLIYRPPGTPPENAPDLHCAVTLVYQGEKEEKGEAPPEIRFTRKISMRGTTTYLVDGDIMSRVAYEERLAEIGVLVKARNFLVFQGDVENLARKSPKELVELIETVSGSNEFASSYDAALTAKEQAEKTRLFVAKQKKHLEHERQQLKTQKQEAEKFFDLQKDRALALTDLYLYILFHIDQDKSTSEHTLSDLHEQLEGCREEQTERQAELQTCKSSLSKARRAVQAVSVQAVDTSALDQCRAAIQTTTRQIAKDETALQTHTKAATEHKDRQEKLETDIASFRESLDSLVEEYNESAQQASDIVLTAEQEDELERVKAAAAAASTEPRHVLQTASRALQAARRNAVDLDDSLVTTATKDVKDLETRRDSLQETLTETQASLKAIEAKHSDVLKTNRLAQTRRDNLEVELEKLNSQLRDAGNFKSQNAAEERLMNAISILKTNFTGVHGRLVDLCRPTQRKYARAVTVAAGKDMDAIVVDTRAVALECIQYFRDQKIGTATFLPLDNIQVQPDPEGLRQALDDRYRLAVDVMHCSDPAVRQAVRYAVGNTVVADDLDAARQLCFGRSQHRVKAVTLQGAVISRAGTMTGGSTAQDAVSRWKSQDIMKLREKREELEGEKAELDSVHRAKRELEDLRNQMGSLRNKENFTKADLEYTKNQLKEKDSLLASSKKNLKKLQKQSATAEKQITRAQKVVEDAQAAVKATEDEHFAAFREETGLVDIQAYEDNFGKRRDDFNKKKGALTEHITELEQQLEYESGRDMQQPIAKTKKRLSERQKKLAKLEAQFEDLEEEVEKAEAALEKAKTAMEKTIADEKECEVQVKRSQSEYKKAQEETASVQKQINKEDAALERLRGKLHETLQKARVEKVELPLVGRSGPLRTRRSRGGHGTQTDDEGMSSSQFAESQESSNMPSMTQLSQENYPAAVQDQQQAATVDYTSMNELLKRRGSDRDERKTRKEFEDKITKLTSEIDGITPNMKANDAFSMATKRLKDSKQEHETAMDDATKATKDFLKIKAKRTKRFLQAYDKIEEALKTIYTDMTKSSKHPLGGNAYLSLDETEEPYKGGLKFNAMPPMKRFRDMEQVTSSTSHVVMYLTSSGLFQLSGGEKTVAALSLLFAIHSFHPAPFFVMDEVDAALDNINLRKVCNYIQQRSQKDFQCIVISLKDGFYEHSNSLVGICRDVSTSASQTVTLDLTKFDKKRRKSKRSSRASESVSTTPTKKRASGESGTEFMSPLSPR